MFKVNNKDTRSISLMSFCCFIVNFKHILHRFLVFLLLTLNKQMLARLFAEILLHSISQKTLDILKTSLDFKTVLMCYKVFITLQQI